MKPRGFSLKPFPSNVILPQLEIAGEIRRSSTAISVAYRLSGHLEDLMLPEPGRICMRKNRLWEETCFELFIGPENSGQYWEFNLSTSGNWNVYCFTAYRKGMQEEKAFAELPFSVMTEPGSLELSLEVGLQKIVRADQALKIGACAVMKNIDGMLTYWALTHPDPQPDFHNRDGFIIDL